MAEPKKTKPTTKPLIVWALWKYRQCPYDRGHPPYRRLELYFSRKTAARERDIWMATGSHDFAATIEEMVVSRG